MSPESRERLVRRGGEWLFEQGALAVLLLALIGGGFYYSPKFLDALERSNRDKDAAHTRDLKAITNAYERDQSRDDERYRDLTGRWPNRPAAQGGR